MGLLASYETQNKKIGPKESQKFLSFLNLAFFVIFIFTYPIPIKKSKIVQIYKYSHRFSLQTV